LLGKAYLSANTVAQAVNITTPTVDVGKVYIYIFGPYGTVDFDINLSLYVGDSTGKPDTLVSTATLAGSEITEDGWYAFEFNYSGVSPASGYLTFVFDQDGGDVNNYVLWGYASAESSSDYTYPAFNSNDLTTWTSQENVIYGIKLAGTYDPFNLDDNQIDSPSGEVTRITPGVGGANAEYENTQIISDAIQLDQPDTLISLVIDSSGSMGWNDRYENRQRFAQTIVDKYKNNYPSDVLFDFVKFGAIIANPESITSGLGTTLSINLDARVPTRTTYTFAVDNVKVYVGDVYSHNGNDYTIIVDTFLQDQVIAVGTTAPLSSGTLTKSSGAGYPSFEFSSFEQVTVDNGQFVAYGIKNLIDNRTYNFSGFKVDNALVDPIKVDTWDVFYRYGASSLSQGINGPKNTASVDIINSEDATARKTFSSNVVSSLIQSPVTRLDTTVEVDDPSIFVEGESIDLVDDQLANIGLVVSNVSSNTVTFTPETNYPTKNNTRGRAFKSTANSVYNFDGTTIQLYVRDESHLTGEKATFFLQDRSGLTIEWDFQPHDEWKSYNIYWLDETAILPISVFDTDGNAFPDGTQIDLEVNQRTLISEVEEVASKLATEISIIGSSRIYLEDTGGLAREDVIDLVDNDNNLQTVTIDEIGEDTTLGPYIDILETLTFIFSPDNGARVVKKESDANLPSIGSQVSLLPSIVDVTPLVTNTSMPASYLLPHDPDPVPLGTSYADLNTNRDYIIRGNRDAISLNGEAAIRVLPLTEDNLKTIEEKTTEAERLLRSDPPEQRIDQDLRDDTDEVTDSPTQEDEDTTLEGRDYTIESPVFLTEGKSSSSMTSIATEFTEEVFDGLTLLGTDEDSLLVKEYTIYPSILLQNSSGANLARQYFEEFLIYFTPSVFIASSMSNTVAYWCENTSLAAVGDCPTFRGYEREQISGIYAGGEEDITISYTVSEKFALMKTGKLNITLYTNKVRNLDDAACQAEALADFFINARLPLETETVDGDEVTTEPLSTINQWRTDVENNLNAEVLEDINLTSEEIDIDSLNIGSSGAAAILGGSAGAIDRYNALVGERDSSIQNELNNLLGAEETTVNLLYSNPNEWIKATQYDTYETTIDVVNGKASITIPANDTVSLMLVEAAYDFGDGRLEAVRADLFFNANPVDAGNIEPLEILPDDGESYELGTTVYYENGEIEDNIQIEFSSDTGIIPSVSVTNDGRADGVYIGPSREIWLDPADYEDSLCPPTEVTEEINVKISHPSGYVKTAKRKIAWKVRYKDSTDDQQFYFKVNTDSVESWADGTSDLSTTISSDLNDGVNELYDGLVWVGSDGVDRLQGEGQLNNEASIVKGTSTIPSRMQWTNGAVDFKYKDLNSNIGNEQPICDSGDILPYPWNQEVVLRTSYKTDTGQLRIGEGATSRPAPNDAGDIIVPHPYAKFKEPLGIALSIETEGGELIRNGSQTPEIVATVTWRGERLTDTFTLNPNTDAETVINYPMPTVRFESGTCGISNTDDSGDCNQYKDTRGDIDGCLTILDENEVSLSSYSAKVELTRTDVFTVIGTSHTHTCEVDENGNGVTTGMILMDGIVPDHTHTITNYQSDEILLHSHELRSVAIVELNPITTANLNIAINGYVDYDPTNTSAYNGAVRLVEPINGNRMMFGTLHLLGTEPTQPTLTIDLAFGDDLTIGDPVDIDNETVSFYSASTPIETDKGFDIKASAYMSSYIFEDFPGHFITIPERDVDDGTRISIDITAFKPKAKISLGDQEIETGNILTLVEGSTRDYVMLKVLATTSFEGQSSKKEAFVMIRSNIQWLPNVKGLVGEPTLDDLYVANAISSIETLGASQMHDAIEFAAQRMIQFQTDDSSLSDYKKVIYLLTDGDENTSEKSIDQAIDHVSFIEGTDETPVIPIKLGYTHGTDQLLLEKYAADTSSNVAYSVDLTNSQVDEVVDYVISSGLFDKINQGIYTEKIILNEGSLPIRVSLGSATLPTNSRATFRVRKSIDGINWDVWSIWFDYDENMTFSDNENGKYFEYEVKLFGNEDFESPVIEDGATLEYYKKGESVVFFNPIAIGSVGQTGQIEIGGTGVNASGGAGEYESTGNIVGGITDDQYVASIHITHEADIPATSKVEYGIQQEGSNEIEDFYIQGKAISSDEHTILLTRYNEPLETLDNREYTAINGRFSEFSTIDIYRLNAQNPNGALVTSEEYAVNGALGLISFNVTQSSNDTFVFSVDMAPTYKIICRAINYGSEQAKIHYVGIMYNVMDRIPRELNGNIIHTPIGDRIL
tara:strand:+ start:323 stop:7156 length:6834 start_codon:yes stop_codon:yes gene_type:complete